MSEKITLEVLEERLSNWFAENKTDHDEIIKQTTKTNGRVTANCEWISKAKGALMVIEIILVPIILYIGYNILQKFF